MPRQTLLTDDIQRRICGYVNGGVSIPTACRASGISWDTVKDWLSKGRDGQEPYAAFVEEVERAKAAWEAAAVIRITAAGAKDWRAPAWLLERRVKEYRKPEHRVELTGKDGGALQVQAKPISRAEALAELKELAKSDPEIMRLLAESMGNVPVLGSGE